MADLVREDRSVVCSGPCWIKIVDCTWPRSDRREPYESDEREKKRGQDLYLGIVKGLPFRNGKPRPWLAVYSTCWPSMYGRHDSDGNLRSSSGGSLWHRGVDNFFPDSVHSLDIRG